MDPPTNSYTILPATEIDIPSLAETLTWSYISEAIMPFLFPDWPRPDTLLHGMTARVQGNIAEPHATVYKAVDDATGAVAGMVCLTLESGEKKVVEKTVEGTRARAGAPSESQNGGLAELLGEKLGQWDSFMEGKRHYMLSSLAVDPKYHRKGLGTKLMDYCHEVADRDGLPIFLTAFPGALHLYLKWGYEDVGHFEVDLNEYGRKNRGYGVYRGTAMVRNAKEKES